MMLGRRTNGRSRSVASASRRRSRGSYGSSCPTTRATCTAAPWSPMAGSPRWAARSTRRCDHVIDSDVADALMAIALDEARAAATHGDVPIGAVIARLGDGEVLARRHNARERLG